MTTYTDVFTGDAIQPTDVSYQSLSLATNQTLTWPIPRILDVTGATGTTKLILPAANVASVGQDVLINNRGANAFSVYTQDGVGVVGTVASGKSAYVYMTDNSTANGVWAYTDFASTSTSATAGALQGYGVRAISTAPTVLSAAHAVTDWNTTTKTTALTDRAGMINYTGASSAALTLQNSAAESNYFFLFRNSGTATVTMTPSSGTIDGQASKAVPQTNACIVCFDGTNWWTVGYGQSAAFAFQAATMIVTGASGTVAASSLGGYNSAATLLAFSGTPTGNVTITFGTSAQLYTFYNNATMGAYTLSIKTTSGSNTITLRQGERLPVYCDGNDLITAISPTTVETEGFALAMAVALG